MKFTVQSSDLEAILAAACSVAKAGSPIRIIAERIGEPLDDFQPDREERPVEAGQVRIVAFNDNIVAEWRRPAEIRMTGSVAVVPLGLDRLVKTSRSSDATFTLETLTTDNEKSLRLATSRSAHEFAAQSEAVFDTVHPGRTLANQADLTNLAKAIDIAKIASAGRAEASGAKIALTGVHLRSRDEKLDVVCTDGKRLALSTLQSDEIGAIDLGRNASTGITIPPEGVPLATAMLASGSASMTVLENNLVIENRDGCVSIRLIESPYPNYEAILDLPTEHEITLPRSDIEIALQRSSVSLAKDARTAAVKLSRGADGIHVASAVAGQSSSECISEEPGEDSAIGFDPRYMLAAIGPLGKAAVRLQFGSGNTPIRITTANLAHVLMLVMPCKTS